MGRYSNWKEFVTHAAKNYARNHVLFRKFAKNAKYAYESKKYERGSKGTVTDDHLIYFNAFSGRGYADSPKAIYLSMLEDERFNDYRFVWVFRDIDEYKYLLENPRTYIIELDSDEEVKVLQEAKYWITNYRVFDKYIPRDDQVYVQCWHGTPLKRLGYDITSGDNAMNSREEIMEKYYRDALRFKYLISPSGFATEKFKSAWNLTELGREDVIIEEGYPRNDRLINYRPDEVAGIKSSLGIPDGKKVILYVPTWRDNQYSNRESNYVYESEVDFDYLSEKLRDDFVILFRAHYLVSNSFDFKKYEGFIYDVSDHSDINDLFIVSDMMITDYSSAFFDYANLKRPVILHMYDLEEYRDSIRGFYLDIEELPWPVTQDEEELVKAVLDADKNGPDEAEYERFNERFNYLDDGKASERVINRIFFSDENM